MLSSVKLNITSRWRQGGGGGLSLVPHGPQTVTREQKKLAFPFPANRLSLLNPAPYRRLHSHRSQSSRLFLIRLLPLSRRRGGRSNSIASHDPGREPGVADRERLRRICGCAGTEAGIGGGREGRGGPVGGAAAAVGADGADDGRRPGRVGVPRGGQHAPLGGHHRGIRRDGLRGHLLPPRAGLHRRVPVQAAQGAVRHPLLPPQRRRARQHLPGHPPGQVVLRLRRAHHPPLHPEPARRAEQRLAAQHAGGGALGEPGRYAIRHHASRLVLSESRSLSF
uniref:Uncharacterized protein n=1 Tax=Zea mays TaxID=4577 RepID=A0A804QHE5_MAIZE